MICKITFFWSAISIILFLCGFILNGSFGIVFFSRSVLFSHLLAFVCKGKSQCPYPGDPPNGLIAPLKFHYDPGDYLSVQCRPGFVEYGSNGPPERPR